MGVRAMGIGFIEKARSLRIINSHVGRINQYITPFFCGDSRTTFFEDGLCACSAKLCL